MEQPGKVSLGEESAVVGWVRDSLAQHCLGSRLLDIFRNHTLLEAWYCRCESRGTAQLCPGTSR